MEFQSLIKDKKILQAIEKLGFKTPSEVQQKAIPLLLAHRDVIVQSHTGSGKTAAFGIPLCQNINIEQRNPQVLILSPTRELAVQVKQDIENIGLYKRVHCIALFGKQPISFQQKELKQRVHMVVGTPGRTLDHINKGSLAVEDIRYLVIDEADEMLNMGFIDEVSSIIKQIPKSRTTMLFSATMPKEIENLCASYMKNPERINLSSDNITLSNIIQKYISVNSKEKLNTIEDFLYVQNPDNCIIFCNLKDTVDTLYQKFEKLNWPSVKLQGDMLQKDRLQAIKDFKTGKARFLIATDIAARGLDIEKLSCIINYDMPVEKERYVHRIGRTGRAGEKGMAVSFVAEYDSRKLEDIEKYINSKLEELELQPQDIDKSKIDAFKTKNILKHKELKGAKLKNDSLKLHLNLGKDKKIRPGDIAGAISNIEGINGDDIGIIEIWDRFSEVTILNGKGKLVLNNLQNLKGRNVKAAIAEKSR